jgi:hypothetical protein
MAGDIMTDSWPNPSGDRFQQLGLSSTSNFAVRFLAVSGTNPSMRFVLIKGLYKNNWMLFSWARDFTVRPRKQRRRLDGAEK